MTTFNSLLDLVYPKNSVYLCTHSTNPGTLFGGTWGQHKGAVLAATGANSFANVNQTGGSLKISINQMPSHTHNMSYLNGLTKGNYAPGCVGNSGNSIYSNNVASNDPWIETTGGATTSCRTITQSTAGHALRRCFCQGVMNNG